jgi:hypothetical protein
VVVVEIEEAEEVVVEVADQDLEVVQKFKVAGIHLKIPGNVLKSLMIISLKIQWDFYRGGDRDGFNGRNQSYENKQGYQDNRKNYQDARPNQNFHNQRNDNNYAQQYHHNQGYEQPIQQVYQNTQNYQQNQGNYYAQSYSNQRQDSQQYHDQNYQNPGFQGKGPYQHEHDDRANYQDRNNQRGRGRSNYNRGGRYWGYLNIFPNDTHYYDKLWTLHHPLFALQQFNISETLTDPFSVGTFYFHWSIVNRYTVKPHLTSISR